MLEQDCALILLDVQMPELDGFETAALIRERERTRYTPIIFVTAVRREEEHILKGYANGAVDYVIKPFAPESMIAKVRAFLDLYRREQALKAEAALRAQERDEFERRERMARAEADAHREHLYALFMKAPAAICIVRGPELRFVLANPRFEEMVGRGNLVGRPGREAIAEPGAQVTWDILEQVQRTGDPFLGNEYPSLWGLSGNEQRFFNFVAQPTKTATGETESVDGPRRRGDRLGGGAAQVRGARQAAAGDRSQQGRVPRHPRARAAQPARSHPHRPAHHAPALDDPPRRRSAR